MNFRGLDAYLSGEDQRERCEECRETYDECVCGGDY